jgi:hypothetical protein
MTLAIIGAMIAVFITPWILRHRGVRWILRDDLTGYDEMIEEKERELEQLRSARTTTACRLERP